MLSDLGEKWRCDCLTHTNFLYVLKLLDGAGVRWRSGDSIESYTPDSGRYVYFEPQGVSYVEGAGGGPNFFRTESDDYEEVTLDDVLSALHGTIKSPFDEQSFVTMLGGG